MVYPNSVKTILDRPINTYIAMLQGNLGALLPPPEPLPLTENDELPGRLRPGSSSF
jgi:hypothetical protein